MFDSIPYEPWVYGLLLLTLVGLIFGSRHLAISNQLRRWRIFLPRIVVLALLLWVLTNPTNRQEFRLPDKPAQVELLVDASRSMGLDEPISRQRSIQNAVAEIDRQLAASERPDIHYFKFGQNLSSLADFGQYRTTDDASLLGSALDQLPGRFSRELPAAVVVFSDGIIDDESQLTSALDTFETLKVPIHVYPVGNAQTRGDVGIDEFVVPRRIDAGAKAIIRGAIRSTGYSGQRVELKVVPADRRNSQVFASLPITLADGSNPFELVVESNPDLGELMAEVEPLAGEATTLNNRVKFELASDRRRLRVLYMEGTGGSEYHWVHDALIEDKSIECVSLIADQQYVQRPRLVRVDDHNRGFPTLREELLKFDVIICSDISLGAYTKEQLDWVVELVSERGGGFAMVGGITSFGAGGWDQTVWDQLIPVDMAGGSLGRGWLYHTFQVSVPKDAMEHPIWKIVEDPVINQRAIAAMPVFHGTNYIERLKPAATPLAYSATPIPNINRVMPIFAAQPYGKGRTFAFSPDTTADWGRDFESRWGEGDNRYFRRFWRNLVRWLGENSIANRGRLQVETDKTLYRAGESVKLSAIAFDENQQPTLDYEIRIEVKIPSDVVAGRIIGNGSLTADASGQKYDGELDPLQLTGIFERTNDGTTDHESSILPTRVIEVIAIQSGKEIARSTSKIQILPDLHELLNPQPRSDILARIADATGGRVLRSSQEVVSVLKSLPKTAGESLISRQPLWDRQWVWCLIVVLLAIEWSLRRVAGYG